MDCLSSGTSVLRHSGTPALRHFVSPALHNPSLALRLVRSVVPTPTNLDVKKDKGLTIAWSDGSSSYISVARLRKMSPSADMRELRNQMNSNPLTVLPASASRSTGPLTIKAAELVGNYALKICFSDGHDTGIYTWEYLRELAVEQPG
jgi:DUF971 family protein